MRIITASMFLQHHRSRWVLTLIAGVFVLLLNAGSIIGQGLMLPLPSHIGTIVEGVRGYWFVSPAKCRLTHVYVPTSAGQGHQQFQLIKLTEAPTYSHIITGFTTLDYCINAASDNIIDLDVSIDSGDVIGLIGRRVADIGTGVNSIGEGGYVSSLLERPVTLRRLSTNHSFANGQPATTVFASVDETDIGRVHLYYEPDCMIPPGTLSADLIDAFGKTPDIGYIPGKLYMQYSIGFPDTSSFVKVRFDFYHIESNPNTVAFSIEQLDRKAARYTLADTEPFNIPATALPGYYEVRRTVFSLNSCLYLDSTYLGNNSIILIPPGQPLCSVWPGDVNNDGLVNYSDKKTLDIYLSAAGGSPSWLRGPRRIDGVSYNYGEAISWRLHTAIPWLTALGCYMDADGNGVVDNNDKFVINANWMRDNGKPRKDEQSSVQGFAVSDNFPNPFNPVTNVTVVLPEQSYVRFVVFDAAGKQAGIISDAILTTGTHTLSYRASNLPSGNYTAIAFILGTESGTYYQKAIGMTLRK